MAESPDEEIPTRDPVAVANMLLIVGLINKLRDKKVLTDNDVKEFIDLTLRSLEEAGAHDPVSLNAHKLVEAILNSYSRRLLPR